MKIKFLMPALVLLGLCAYNTASADVMVSAGSNGFALQLTSDSLYHAVPVAVPAPAVHHVHHVPAPAPEVHHVHHVHHAPAHPPVHHHHVHHHGPHHSPHHGPHHGHHR